MPDSSAYFARHAPRLALLQDAKEATPGRPLLRRAQLGAGWALASHFTTSSDPALVSLPTGSGKTAVMCLIPYLLPSRRVMVIAPTRLLRGQIEAEFRSLAALRRTLVCPADMPGPHVHEVEHIVRDTDSWGAMEAYDVVVGTPSCMSPLNQNVANVPEGLFDTIIVDEAHHISAPTWQAILKDNPGVRIALFTATPFRRDKKQLDAKSVYTYTLRQALEDDILRPVTYRPVAVAPGEDPDVALSSAARERLRSEEHGVAESRLLVRTDTVAHANALVGTYAQQGIRLKSVTFSTSPAQLRSALGELREGRLDGLANVGVLGEGFDYPELKIGVYHRRHKSLPATLQFLGRISRVSVTSAPAELLAIREEIEDETRSLYLSEMSWADLLPGIVDAAVAAEHERREYLSTFEPLPVGPISLAAIMPRKYFQVFRVSAESWGTVNMTASPETISDGDVIYDATDAQHLTKVVITRKIVRPDWLNSLALDTPYFELYVLCGFPAHNLMFVSAPDDRRAEAVMRIIGVAAPELVEPEWIDQMMAAQRLIAYFSLGMRSVQPGSPRLASYRSMAGQSVGTAVRRSETRQYASGHAIAKVVDPLAMPHEFGRTTSLGVSHGRSVLFSPDHASLLDIRRWCHRIAELAVTISDVPVGLPGLPLLSARRLEDFPDNPYAAIMDVDIMWSGLYTLLSDGKVAYIDAVELIAEPVSGKTLQLVARYEDRVIWIGELDVRGNINGGGPDLEVYASGGTASVGTFAEMLTDNPPTIFYGDASASRGRVLLRAQTDYPDLDSSVLQEWDRKNVDLSAESKKPRKGQTTIHDWTTSHLSIDSERQWIIKDDGSGEIADLVVIEAPAAPDDEWNLTFVHCKWSKEDYVGRRLIDLYELLGQAARTVRWTNGGIIWHELLRRLDERKSTQIVKGDAKLIRESFAANKASPPRCSMNVICVQPGLDVQRVNVWPAGKPLVCSTHDWLASNDIDMKLVGSR
jgi:superfamily II DNA or RNA helicase